ncbi:hypothetical protein CPB83DRAFT_650552 [Crepidotus variabilis]|uniref:Uncharacterized protein n=1 Tax=Crepidotus variabilis TaxID=179855 RepID=A0A9P6E715_9AGAR|nr:hypothetical protein CPB83DRAFT_650552 [Crepidotus variabilis]
MSITLNKVNFYLIKRCEVAFKYIRSKTGKYLLHLSLPLNLTRFDACGLSTAKQPIAQDCRYIHSSSSNTHLRCRFYPQSFNAFRNVGSTYMVIQAANVIVPDLLPSGIRELIQLIQQDGENKLGLIKWMSELDKVMTPELHIGAFSYRRHLFRVRE